MQGTEGSVSGEGRARRVPFSEFLEVIAELSLSDKEAGREGSGEELYWKGVSTLRGRGSAMKGKLHGACQGGGKPLMSSRLIIFKGDKHTRTKK